MGSFEPTMILEVEIKPIVSTLKDQYTVGWVQDSCQGPKLIPGHPLA